MKYIKVILCYLCLCVNIIACAQTTTQDSEITPIALSDSMKKLYHSGQFLILYSYRNQVIDSEAYADWNSYLSEFKQQEGKNNLYYKVAPKDFEAVIAGATEFTLFLKKGYPVYIYDGFIVEPQVYTSVHRKFSNEILTDIDKAFLPDKINDNKSRAQGTKK